MEIWKKIPGYDMYEISNFGRVRSKYKALAENSGIMSISPTNMVQLYSDGIAKSFLVSKLMGEVFFKKKPGQIIFHLDKNPRNNRVENLIPIFKKELYKYTNCV